MFIDENGVIRHRLSIEQLTRLYSMLEDFFADLSVEEAEDSRGYVTELKVLIHSRMKKTAKRK